MPPSLGSFRVFFPLPGRGVCWLSVSTLPSGGEHPLKVQNSAPAGDSGKDSGKEGGRYLPGLLPPPGTASFPTGSSRPSLRVTLGDATTGPHSENYTKPHESPRPHPLGQGSRGGRARLCPEAGAPGPASRPHGPLPPAGHHVRGHREATATPHPGLPSGGSTCTGLGFRDHYTRLPFAVAESYAHFRTQKVSVL